MKLYFIRHADPDYSIDSLTAKGWHEAELLADRIARLGGIRDIYCSPLGRAQDTARVCLEPLGRTVITKDWLREFPAVMQMPDGRYRMPWDFVPGWWTKQPDLYDKDSWFRGPTMSRGGNVEEWYLRVTRGLDEILEGYGYRRDGNFYRTDAGNADTIVFFCHLGVMFVMLSHLLSIATPVLWQNCFVAPSSVTLVSTEEVIPGEVAFRMKYFGDISHLYAAGEEPSGSGFFAEYQPRGDKRLQ